MFNKQKYMKQYRQDNKDKLKEYAKIYYKIYYQENQDKIINQSAQYYSNNKDKVAIRSHKKYMERRALWILWLSSFLKLECMACKFNLSFFALDFHHIDPKKKESNISKLLNNPCSVKRQEKVKKEIEGTILLCSNCHRMWHGEYKTYEVG